ncbi:beta-ketoacyl synthase N-terminal-like domain-containing protein [Plantactinospora sp. WMMB334]|uniref:beta-ketoacyl synthase N-terminal-like domain-containing protein n=1 Tax=Plantactinospora sp. WMMB334 TaxID=3404119 RepID=UPI003B92C453
MADPARPRITGIDVLSASGRGAQAQLAAVLTGAPAFRAVDRFEVTARRVGTAATLAGAGPLADELVATVDGACRDAGLDAAGRAGCPLLLAVHGGPGTVELAGAVAAGAGLRAGVRVYTTACVSGSTALIAAAARIAAGTLDRAVVAAGYLVEPEQFALFDSGLTLARDGAVRPFSAGRQGLLLGDAVTAVVLEAPTARPTRDAIATIAGWGRAGDAYHPCQPDPTGQGLARAAGAALRRAGLDAAAVGYVNANANGTSLGDAAEAAALGRIFGAAVGAVPVSSTKSVHGHGLEGSALLELVITALALRHGKLPVNAGFLAADPACPLDVITAAPRPVVSPYALSLNSAFGGANTAVLVRTP